MGHRALHPIGWVIPRRLTASDRTCEVVNRGKVEDPPRRVLKLSSRGAQVLDIPVGSHLVDVPQIVKFGTVTKSKSALHTGEGEDERSRHQNKNGKRSQHQWYCFSQVTRNE